MVTTKATLILQLELKMAQPNSEFPRTLSGPQIPLRCPSHPLHCLVTDQVGHPTPNPAFLCQDSKVFRARLPQLFPLPSGNRSFACSIQKGSSFSQPRTFFSTAMFALFFFSTQKFVFQPLVFFQLHKGFFFQPRKFFFFFQPRKNVSNHRFLQVNVFLVWVHKNLGLCSPAQAKQNTAKERTAQSKGKHSTKQSTKQSTKAKHKSKAREKHLSERIARRCPIIQQSNKQTD